MARSLIKAMLLLEFIGQKSDGYSFKQLAESLNFPNSTLWGLLKDLVELKYLSFDLNTKRYFLGPQILVLAGHYLANLDIVQIGRPFIKRAVELSNESSLLIVKYENHGLFVIREDCDKNFITSAAKVGQLAPMYATPSGKAMLAYMADDELLKYISSVEFKPINRHTITDPERLLKELEVIRTEGIAYSHEEFHEGITAMGVPVFNVYGEAIAAIDIPVPTTRLNREKEKKIEFILKGLSNEFSKRLGFGGIPARFKDQ